MSGQSTGNNTFRGALKGHDKFLFGQNLETVTTTKNKEAQEHDNKTVQNFQLAGGHPKNIFVEPNIQLHLRNKTRGNQSFGLKSNQPRWQTPITNNFPSSDFGATKMSMKSSYENYAEHFVKNRTSKEGKLKQDYGSTNTGTQKK